MEFRPCIDIHDGKVKQIVGGSMDHEDRAKENYVAAQDAAYFAEFYKNKKIKGGHVILLNGRDHALYEKTKEQAIKALKAYPLGLQVGGGITTENAAEFLDGGASHVIVTSYVFSGGKVNYENLDKLVREVGSGHLVLDLSCRKKNGKYYIVTDRWQNFTDTELDYDLLCSLENKCAEYLIHAVDVEGKASGIESEVAALLGLYENRPVTYAGGVHNYEDLELLKRLGRGHVNVTVGSALDIFGGSMKLDKVLEFCR